MTVRLISMLLAASLMTGCASMFYEREEEFYESDEVRTEVDFLMEQYRKELLAERKFLAEDVWLAGELIETKTVIPEELKQTFSWNARGKTLPQITARISDLTDVRIVIGSDVLAKPGDSGGFEVSEDQGEATDAAGGTVTLAGQASPSVGSSGGAAELQPYQTRVDFKNDNKPIYKALDKVAALYNLSWTYDEAENTVKIYRLEHKTFQIFYAGQSSAEVGFEGGEGSGSALSQTVATAGTSGSWEEIAEAIRTRLSPWGNAVIAKSSGTVTISDSPDAMSDVERYIEDVNRIYGRQVTLQVKVLSVNMSKDRRFNAEWQDITKIIRNQQVALGLESAPTPAGDANVFSILRGGSTAVNLAVSMLATRAEVSEVTSGSFTTLTGHPVPIRLTSDTGYISDVVEETVESTGDRLRNIETDIITSGFSMLLYPRVLSLQNLQLLVAIEDSQLVELRSLGDQGVETPLLDRRTINQRVLLRNQDTLVLAGFATDSSDRSRQGTGDEGFWLFGGGQESSKLETVLLVMITPYIAGRG